MTDHNQTHLFCLRCGKHLLPGRSDFYIVRIEAVADPTPPDLDVEGDLDINAEFSRLFEQMKEMSEQELMDQVHRKLTLHLCGKCYREWIENPIG